MYILEIHLKTFLRFTLGPQKQEEDDCQFHTHITLDYQILKRLDRLGQGG